MAIVVRLLPPQNIEATIDNRVWTCDDELLLHVLTAMTVVFQRSMGYAPDPDWPIAQEAIRRYGGEIIHEDEAPEWSEEDEPDERGCYPIY